MQTPLAPPPQPHPTVGGSPAPSPWDCLGLWLQDSFTCFLFQEVCVPNSPQSPLSPGCHEAQGRQPGGPHAHRADPHVAEPPASPNPSSPALTLEPSSEPRATSHPWPQDDILLMFLLFPLIKGTISLYANLNNNNNNIIISVASGRVWRKWSS